MPASFPGFAAGASHVRVPMISAVVITETQELDPHLDDWDRLAVLRGQPYSAPAWMLAWWRHASPPGARLAVVIVNDDDRVIGVAPMFQRRTRAGLWVARQLGTGHRVEPLAEPGREWEVASAAVDALRGLPDPPGAVLLDRGDARSPWPALLASAWPRPATTLWSELIGAPAVRLSGRTYDEWLAERSGNFRAQHRRRRRRLAERGAEFRLVGPGDDVSAPIASFIALTIDRWVLHLGAGRGPEGIRAMLLEAAADLVPRGRMRIWTLEAEGRAVSTQVFLAAGGEVAYWNGGYDERWAKLRPGFETIIRAIEHSFAQGDRRLDLGGGATGYKRRMTGDDDPIRSVLLLPGGNDRPLRRAQLLPQDLERLAHHAARRAPDWVQRRLRAMRG
jgi:CelD/BcsL family acetyltransferase involved in cellulose biosynthesis